MMMMVSWAAIVIVCGEQLGDDKDGECDVCQEQDEDGDVQDGALFELLSTNLIDGYLAQL